MANRGTRSSPSTSSEDEISAKDRRDPTLEGGTPFFRRRSLIHRGADQSPANLRLDQLNPSSAGSQLWAQAVAEVLGG